MAFITKALLCHVFLSQGGIAWKLKASLTVITYIIIGLHVLDSSEEQTKCQYMELAITSAKEVCFFHSLFICLCF